MMTELRFPSTSARTFAGLSTRSFSKRRLESSAVDFYAPLKQQFDAAPSVDANVVGDAVIWLGD